MTHLALVGPTASGKSALALELANKLGDIEIVSCDSMQVYRGLDIGTAKASPDERSQVPHHLVDVIDPEEEWSVARFQQAARAAVADIESRNKRALLVGGTGLYFQAVVDDLRIPGEDPDVRAALEARTTEPGGIASAYAELAERDPLAASRVDPHNARRIVRALEVMEVTGKPFSSFGPGVHTPGPTAFAVRIAGIWLPRDVTASRITARVAAMRDAGLLAEVVALRGRLSRTAAQAIGYREVLRHLDSEHHALDDALAEAARRTRSFARRQRMWFRRDRRIVWYATARNPDAVLPGLLAAWG